MPFWLRRSLVVLISIFTFGMVSPAQASELLLADQQKSGDKSDVVETSAIETESFFAEEIGKPSENIVNRLIKQAEEKSFEKFGDRIGPVIEDEFRQMILPNIEQVITMISADFSEEELEYIAITEVPSGGHSEKIFHISCKDNVELIRFHVRRDRPPHQGYWFNFHYHTYHDQFSSHYELGTIYWDKNTPPNWRS
ncbi:YpjP family protein [Bacillus sp. B15-48]|uniref:YpjP family protein n=1 Tax=Bacillus sp. B15-48 TaxID=1548601 RepID=UPI00194004FC|nr:YpjP family protein [Bacillus sp. B15-48]MBM4762043.1 hypothetical protein [Bacillus sp. B15-48]